MLKLKIAIIWEEIIVSETNKVKDTIEAVTGLVEAVPVYEDLAQPAAKELGKTLLTGAKLINMALSPISAMVWGYDQVRDFIIPKLEEKLKKVPEENIITPDPIIAVPTIEALRYTASNETLRELYANLLANSMNSETKISTHPSFVEIIKQLTSDEAKILKYIYDCKLSSDGVIQLISINDDNTYHIVLDVFTDLPFLANCDNTDMVQPYFENLTRLKLINYDFNHTRSNKNVYDRLENHFEIQKLIQTLKDEDATTHTKFKRGVLTTTLFGDHFLKSCLG